ncbi:3-hydroxybutyrate oligomer hydrolase family protein [Marinobacter caseinilyticus]|uniref:3-hydroxybutyrate oligomer hydrolase family protein n=1 Tax=Marinobacter caseinilyticus TaxID=2692195 RepID=UPI00140A7C7A|nr:3-hydroxybutyrate oligomer hydrolase family protein [Marinobacter caseinilyticus]
MTIRAPLAILAGTCVALSLTACNDSNNNDDPTLNQRPDFVMGAIQARQHPVDANDLLTGGSGATGLASGTPPAFADALNPTVDELRTLAIYNNYRALVDTSAGGGYGTLFGPQVGAADAEGRIGGGEFLAFIDGGSVPLSVMVQIPDTFDPQFACMVTAPSSGSRGIYGAIGTAGEWGLKKGCAVVYTDKGTGTGSHNLATNTAQTLAGQLSNDESVATQFRADLTTAERTEFNNLYPDRLAFKHAHSQANPEADWGLHVLRSIEFGLYILNEQFGTASDRGRIITLVPENTLVIASSVSNGGGASIRAAEQDTRGLIDGVAVSEPNVNPVVDTGFTIRQGAGPVITEHSRSLFDYTTALAVYQGCANRAPSVRDDAPFNSILNNVTINENACSSLAAQGLVTGADLDARAADALRILEQEVGIQPEQNLLAPSHFGLAVAQSISMTYANAYGRFGVDARVCDLSLAASGAGGAVVPLPATQEAALFATSNGIPPTGGVSLIYDNAAGGVPTDLKVSTSAGSGLQDYGLDALLCLRSLALGQDAASGDDLIGVAATQSDRIADGIEAIRATGDLGGKPAIIVTGRADAILPINHTSRPYFGLNRRVEGADSGLRYYEVLNAHHLDVLNGLGGFNERYIPLHRYYFQALDLMYGHLTEQTPLPPSQVIRTTPRGAGAPPLTTAQVPDIPALPDTADRIEFADNQVRIPD